MNLKVKGTILGIVSAVSYGTNPLGALFLYQEGLNSGYLTRLEKMGVLLWGWL